MGGLENLTGSQIGCVMAENGFKDKAIYWLLGLTIVLTGAVWSITWASTSNAASENEARIRDLEKRITIVENNYVHICEKLDEIHKDIKNN